MKNKKKWSTDSSLALSLVIISSTCKRGVRTGVTDWLLLVTHQLYPNSPNSGSVKVHHEHALPLTNDHFALYYGDGLAAAQHHPYQVRVRVDRLLRTPRLKPFRVVDVPAVLPAALRLLGAVGSSVYVVVVVPRALDGLGTRRSLVGRADLEEEILHIPR
ncbi:hypothetical protein THAOC_30562 [Thalassiosira oceanica]|uniref:Uncharacterized protein n=1 Tax=Thalassiosira oceanica TaxID=159749 RepID=K0RDW9_THAOC|nr:hypothetical protein THAOC_30562 [Thalassiosira oceanica]|eukprot:EJK50464.1 hypothetical protein THAOC_30562 [Thalassiosira oceanica]